MRLNTRLEIRTILKRAFLYKNGRYRVDTFIRLGKNYFNCETFK